MPTYEVAMTLTVEAENSANAHLVAAGVERIREGFAEKAGSWAGRPTWLYAGLSPKLSERFESGEAAQRREILARPAADEPVTVPELARALWPEVVEVEPVPLTECPNLHNRGAYGAEWHAKLAEAIEWAEANPEHFELPGFNQPGAFWVVAAEDDFEQAGFDRKAVPWGAIALLAHAKAEEDEAQEDYDRADGLIE